MSVLHLPILPVLQTMQPIDLAEMNAIKLMNRIDTKFLAPSRLLEELLNRAAADYRIQEVDNKRVGCYDTLYYDTPDVAMYVCHHNQQLCRQKIRARTYVDSDLSFLEIKNKTNKGRTKKVRMKIARDDFFGFFSNGEAVDFIRQKGAYPLESLLPQVRTGFNRITLVNRAKTERLTIDTGLSFENLATGRSCSLPELMIIELKQDGMMPSEMKAILLEMRIKPVSISKYCLGTVLTNSSTKQNRFKKKLRYIEKITH